MCNLTDQERDGGIESVHAQVLAFTAASVFDDRSRSSLEVVSPWPLMSNATTRYLNTDTMSLVTEA